MSIDEGQAAQLGAYAAGLVFEELPDAVIGSIKACLLYNLSLALAAHGVAAQDRHAIAAVFDTPGRATLLATGQGRQAPDAAAVNAALIAARGQNDTHPGTGGHIGCVVIPAVLALAQERGTQARQVMAALAAGYEVPPRIAAASQQASGARGFRGTSLYSIFGAAAACARLIGLGAAQTADALAFAANFAGGLTQCWQEGSAEPLLQVAHASRCGMVAALLAERGLRGARSTFEGAHGFYRAFAGSAHAPDMRPRWEIRRVTFKPFPGCAINQAPVEALMNIMRDHGLAAGNVASVVVYLHPSNAHYPGVSRHGPFESANGAIMSAPFMLRLALENATLRSSDFASRFGPDAIHERSRMVSLRADDSMEPLACRVTVAAQDGREWSGLGGGGGPGTDGDNAVRLSRLLSTEWPCGDGVGRCAALCAAVEALAQDRGSAVVERLVQSATASEGG